MPNVCILLANGFEEIEATTVIDVLRRAGVDVRMLGVEGKQVAGAHGMEFVAEGTLAEQAATSWDLVILPGGLPGANTLRDTPAVQSLIAKQNETGGKLAAICAAPIALGKAGVLEGKQATCYPGFESELTGATTSDERVVRDGNVVTSRGPGTAMAFALELVSDLVSPQKASELKEQMLV